MTAEAIVYLALCVGAVTFATHAPKGERLAASILAAGLLANWLFVAWTYATSSPQAAIRSWGLPIHATDLWAIADLALGALAVRVGWHRWWGWAVFSLSMGHLCMHPARSLIGDTLYTFWLDKILLAQVAVFILIGGRGIANRLSFRARLHWVGGFAQGLFTRSARAYSKVVGP
jgi:hypothetical protein